MKKISIVTALSLVMPLSAFAAINNLNDIFTFIRNLLNVILPLIISLTVVYFVWGMFQVFLASDDEKKEKAKNTVIYGVIALFVMISIWGLVNILYNTFGLTNTNRSSEATQQLPTIPQI
ncbi:MAG TPA: pilin [Candidatus Paceibacterota bacterium]